MLINNNVEYGVITNNSGIVVIKNNNPALNKLESSNIDKIIFDCEKEIIKDLKEDKNITFDGTDNHKRILNEYMKKNYNKYFDFYQDRLQDNLDIEIMFINVKR